MGYTATAPIASLWDGVEDAFVDSAESAANRWGGWAEERARELSPVAEIEGLSASQVGGARGRAPGTYKRAWKRRRARRDGRFVTVEFYNDDLVAGWIEYGTRAHIIRPSPSRRPASVVESRRPRRAGTDPRARLRFYVGGRVVYASLVHHPGTRGQFVAHRVVSEGIAVFERLLREELKAHLRNVR